MVVAVDGCASRVKTWFSRARYKEAFCSSIAVVRRERGRLNFARRKKKSIITKNILDRLWHMPGVVSSVRGSGVRSRDKKSVLIKIVDRLWHTVYTWYGYKGERGSIVLGTKISVMIKFWPPLAYDTG